MLPLTRAWPWILAVGVVVYLALFPGSVLLYYFTGVANETLVYALMIIFLAALILSLVAARVADETRSSSRVMPSADGSSTNE